MTDKNASSSNEQDIRRAAVVTGASRGIGRAVATELARNGFNLCINYSSERSAQDAEALVKELIEVFKIDAFALQADVSQSKEAQTLIDGAKERFGRVDVLVNNAGITRDGLLARMKEEDFDDVISINLKGTFNCCKYVTPYMMKQRYGRIVNLGSVVGLAGNPGQVNYAASKAGVVGLSKSLAKEIAARNITVNVVAPGFIETNMTQALDDKQQSAIKDRIASKRLGTPQDVANLVAFLANEQSGYITGQVIGVDGGLTL
ncbi:MAG: 3-oxoacyl-[acyl-carrier-protein] reductase [Raoultibacter sp.]|jgi:3-oxoacyl-[acyl-carrier protein] reductase